MTRQPRAVVVTVQNAAKGARVPAPASVRRWAHAALPTTARGELTVRIVTRAESAALNERYRHKKGPTNVLSFAAESTVQEGDDLLPFGDIVICAAVVAREARDQGKKPAAHWAHMVVHGTLHLLGYDHEKRQDAAAMEARERVLLRTLGFDDPYSID